MTTFDVPLRITVFLGDGGAAPEMREAALDLFEAAKKKRALSVDPDYEKRDGYDPDFLGVRIPLPKLTDAQRRNAAINDLAPAGSDPTVVPYHHFSLVMNRKRRLAYYTACNIDGKRNVDLDRPRDDWDPDKRIPVLEQSGERHYADPIQRGHLVRREDPVWGTQQRALFAEGDTYHFTNCTPQHRNFNANAQLWYGLEKFVLDSAKNEKRRVSVFAGPIFGRNDPPIDDLQVPLAYWKIVVYAPKDDTLSAVGYILEQKTMIEDLLREAATFTASDHQVSIEEIVRRTGLAFNHLERHDALTGVEEGILETTVAGARAIPIRSYADIRL